MARRPGSNRARKDLDVTRDGCIRRNTSKGQCARFACHPGSTDRERNINHEDGTWYVDVRGSNDP